MERDNKCQRTRKIKMLKTLQPNKRTISSEQGHYHTRSNVRKFTLQNQETKKNLYKNTYMSRKNQSLPKTLAALNMYSVNPNKSFRHYNKRIASITQIKLNDQSKIDQQKIMVLQLDNYTSKNGRNLGEVMKDGQLLYQTNKYKEAKQAFAQIYNIVAGKYLKCNYYLGLCEYKLGFLDKAIYYLSKLIDEENGFKMPIEGYEILADAYQNTKNYICALKILDLWISVQPIDKAYLTRARMHFLLKEYEAAIHDYQSCYEINPQKLQAYIEEAEACYQLQGLEKSLEKYNNLLVNYKSIWPESKYIDINYVKYKKSLLLLHQKNYQSALTLLQQITNAQIQTQVHYYQGIIYSVLNNQTNNYEQALACFNKAIEFNTMDRFVAQSYYQKFIIMFKRNDYYGIQYELDLIENRFSNHEPLQMMEKIIGGIISILKMNFKEGIKILDEVITEDRYYTTHSHVKKIFRTTIHSLKSFSFYSIREFKNALQELEVIAKSVKMSSLSIPNQFNYVMLTGILYTLDGNYSQSLKQFEKAEYLEPFNSHTSMIKAITQIMFYQSLYKYEEIAMDKNQKDTIEYQQKNDKNSRKKPGIHQKTRKKVSVSKKKQSNSLHKASNNTVNHIDGVKKQVIAIECSGGTTQQILNQFQNKQILLSAEELLNRCLLKQPENDQILCLLASIYYGLEQYQTGLRYIRKAIDNSDDHMIRHYYVKANLKIMLNMIEEAISDYSNALLVVSQQENEQNKQELIPQIYLQRAKCYIIEGQYSKAEADLKLFFNDVKNYYICKIELVRKYEKQLDLFMHVGCGDLILEIYKNILDKQYDLYNRMKCYYLSKELNSCLSVMNALLDFEDSNDKSENFNPQQLSVDCECLEALRKSSQGSIIVMKDSLKTFQKCLQAGEYGSIFSKSDCMFFAGVLAFYSGEYSKAKNYFIDAKGQKILQGELEVAKAEDDEIYENKPYTLQQMNYNIGICDLVQGKWSPYLDGYDGFKIHKSSNTQNLLSEAEQITPFPIKNRLCSIYGPETQGNICFRLSFCLPKMKLREISFQKNSLILEKISFKDVDMRPSAPWIQKSKKGIVFTDQIIKQSIDLKSEKSKKTKNKKGQNRYKQEL